jgi:hypothetical protein
MRFRTTSLLLFLSIFLASAFSHHFDLPDRRWSPSTFCETMNLNMPFLSNPNCTERNISKRFALPHTREEGNEKVVTKAMWVREGIASSKELGLQGSSSVLFGVSSFLTSSSFFTLFDWGVVSFR